VSENAGMSSECRKRKLKGLEDKQSKETLEKDANEIKKYQEGTK